MSAAPVIMAIRRRAARLGAPLGGTTLGGHQGLEVFASGVITPPKAGGGGGLNLSFQF